MNESLWDGSMLQFRERIAAATPAPGGGAVAAVTVAFAAALLRMVCGISLRHAPDATLGTIEAILAKAQACEAALAGYADEDARAFDAYMATRRNGPSAMSDALLLECARVPMAGTEAVEELQSLVQQIEAVSPAFLASDLATASYLLRAGGESLLANVKINLDALRDGAEKRELQQRYDRLAHRPAPKNLPQN